MNNDDIKLELEALGIDSHKIDEFVIALEQKADNGADQGRPGVDKELELKEQLDAETDWRKKASIAAKIISLNLQ